MNAALSQRRLSRVVALTMAALGSILIFSGGAAGSTNSADAALLTHAEKITLGEQMYRKGILPSGEPMLAVVQQDIEVEGTMFSCESCHLRSGRGSVEGKVITLPTNAAELFKPFTSAAEEVIPPWQTVPAAIQWKVHRPAYTDESLELALSAGVDPTGRQFNWAMPRYHLEDRDMKILIYYLRHLSAAPDPGVTDTTIRFATVIAGEVPKEDRAAMLAVLNAHIQARNGQSRREEERARSAPFYHKKRTTAYRKLELLVWELQGAPDTWKRQLAAHYQQTPVFALLGGISSGEWSPVHSFCEENRLPCLFPITDYPVISDDSWYTLYFSKGLSQEGETAARFLRGMKTLPENTPVVQIYRDDRNGRLIAKAFRELHQKLGQNPPMERPLAEGAVVEADFWREMARTHPGAVLLLWLAPGDLAGLDVLATHPGRPKRMFAAAGLLGEDYATVPEAVRPFTFLTYPYRLPEDLPRHIAVVKSWLKAKNIPATNLKIQSGAYFTGWLLTSALMMMESDYYRDYFLDGIDMMNDEVYAIASYPRLSFGPGQRFAAKGCYVVRLGSGKSPLLEPLSEWVVH